MLGIKTETTCGLNCWLAEEDVCRCYCYGANHGLLLKEGAKQPKRMAKIQGVIYYLYSVVDFFDRVGTTEQNKKARELNKSEIRRKTMVGNKEYTYYYENGDINAPAKIKLASKEQSERWSEVKSVKTGMPRPNLLWIREDIFKKIGVQL